MATFGVRVEIGPESWGRSVTIDADIDPESLFCAIPGDIMGDLGIKEEEFWSFETSKGQLEILPTADAAIRLGRRNIITRIIFAPAVKAPTIGRLALDTVGLKADRKNGVLTPAVQKLHSPMRPI